MLNVILIFAVLLSAAVGFLFVIGFDYDIGGKRYVFFSRKTAAKNHSSLEWDHAQTYLINTPEDMHDGR